MLLIWCSGMETQIISYLFLSVSEPSRPFYTENMQYHLNEHLSLCHRCFFYTEQNNCGVTLLCSSSKKGMTSRVRIWRDGLHASGNNHLLPLLCVGWPRPLLGGYGAPGPRVVSPICRHFSFFFRGLGLDWLRFSSVTTSIAGSQEEQHIYTTDLPWTGCVNIYRLKRSLDKRKVSGSLPSWHKVCREDTGHLPAHWANLGASHMSQATGLNKTHSWCINTVGLDTWSLATNRVI